MPCQKYLERGKRDVRIVPQRGVWCTHCHIQLDWLGSHTIANCLILLCPKGQRKKKTHLTYGKSFLMVLLSSQHALTTHYIPYMFYEMLLPSDGSLKTSLILFCFFLQGLILLWGLPRLVLLSANACMMFDCRLHSEREAEEQERIITTRRTFPQETVTHYLLSLLTPPSLLMLVVLLFHRPVLEIISYCCFFFF